MDKVFNIAIFDYLSVKRNLAVYLLMFITIGGIYGLTLKSLLSTLPVLFLLWATFIAPQTFLKGEKDGLEKLLGTFSIKRRDVVFGRYLSFLFCGILMLVISEILVALLASTLKLSFDIRDIYFAVSTGFTGFILIISIQLPLYFRFGYIRALPVVFFPVLITVLFIVFSQTNLLFGSASVYLGGLTSYMWRHAFVSAVSAVILSAMLLGISAVISKGIYERKDLE